MNLTDNKPLSNSCTTETNYRGFTLLELVVVIGMVSILALLLLPALAGTRPNGAAFQCLNNTKRLAAAWLMYSQDYNDRMIDASHWVAGTMDSQTSNGGPWTTADSTNSAILTNTSISLIAGYIKSVAVFKCPADNYQSAANPAPRVRSYSMNAATGGRVGTIGGNYNPDTGGNDRNYIQNTQGQKTSILNKPGPSKVWVMLDEHPDSISDSIFQFQPGWPPTSYQWQDFPSNLHDGGCGIAFADGHSTIKEWTDSRTTLPVKLLFKWWQPTAGTFKVASSSDYAWMNAGMPYR